MGIQGLQQMVCDKFYSVLKSEGYFNPSNLYRGIYIVKQLAGGFISPTEWVELAYLGVTGNQLSFERGWVNFLWNFGDNFLFLPFEDETTWGLFKFLGTAALNQPWMELKPYAD